MADSKDPKVQEKVAEHLADLTEKLTKKTMDLLVAQNKNVRNVEKETRVKEKQIKAAQRLIDTEVSIQEAKEDLALTQTKEWKENLKLQREAKKFQEKAREARKDYRQELKDSIMEPFRAVKDAIPKPVQILTAWGLRGAKNMTANVLSTAQKSMASMWKGMGKVLGSGPKQLDLFGGPPTPVGTKSEPLEELHAKKIVIEGQQDLFSKEEEKREEGRADKAADKAEKKREGMLSRMMGAGTGGMSKASGFIKKMFGGGLAGLAGIFAPIMAVAGTIMSWVAVPLMIGLVGAGLAWLVKNPEWINQKLNENPKLKAAIETVESVVSKVVFNVSNMIIDASIRGAKKVWEDNWIFSEQNIARGNIARQIKSGKLTPDEGISKLKELLGRPVTPDEKTLFQEAALEGQFSRALKEHRKYSSQFNVREIPTSIDLKYQGQFGMADASPKRLREVKGIFDGVIASIVQEKDKVKKQMAADKFKGAPGKGGQDLPQHVKDERTQLTEALHKNMAEEERLRKLLKTWMDMFPEDAFASSPAHLSKMGAVGKPLNDWLPKLGTISNVLMGILGAVGGVAGHLIVPSSAGAAGLDTHKMSYAKSTSSKSKFSSKFKAQVKSLAADLNVSPEDLIDVFVMESSLNPTEINKESHAAGLMQIMPDNLKKMGFGGTPEEFAKLSPEEQIPWIRKYFLGDKTTGYEGVGPGHLKKVQKSARGGRKLTAAQALYLSVLYPEALGGQSWDENSGFGKWTEHDRGHVVFDKNSKEKKVRDGYFQNMGLDENNDGQITLGDILKGFRVRQNRFTREGGVRPNFGPSPQLQTLSGMSPQNRLALGFGRDLVQGQQQLSLAETIMQSQARSQFGSNQLVMAPQTDASVTNINLAQKTVTNPHGHKFHNTTVVWT